MHSRFTSTNASIGGEASPNIIPNSRRKTGIKRQSSSGGRNGHAEGSGENGGAAGGVGGGCSDSSHRLLSGEPRSIGLLLLYNASRLYVRSIFGRTDRMDSEK